MSQIYKARSGIFLHRHKNIMKNDETSTEHKGGSLSTSTDLSRKMASQINNPSTAISGLGTQSKILSKSEIKPLGTSIIFGGNVSSQLGKLNFKTGDKQKNIKLRL
jgi:hypothetical protein